MMSAIATKFSSAKANDAASDEEIAAITAAIVQHTNHE
jgi:Na+-transporting methylmalonyl-CoA/oxaloacetate decarboxylase gamma subunit